MGKVEIAGEKHENVCRPSFDLQWDYGYDIFSETAAIQGAKMVGLLGEHHGSRDHQLADSATKGKKSSVFDLASLVISLFHVCTPSSPPNVYPISRVFLTRRARKNSRNLSWAPGSMVSISRYMAVEMGDLHGTIGQSVRHGSAKYRMAVLHMHQGSVLDVNMLLSKLVAISRMKPHPKA